MFPKKEILMWSERKGKCSGVLFLTIIISHSSWKIEGRWREAAAAVSDASVLDAPQESGAETQLWSAPSACFWLQNYFPTPVDPKRERGELVYIPPLLLFSPSLQHQQQTPRTSGWAARRSGRSISGISGSSASRWPADPAASPPQEEEEDEEKGGEGGEEGGGGNPAREEETDGLR